MSEFDILTGSELISALTETGVPADKADFFQSPGWLRLWNSQQSYESCAVVLFDHSRLCGYFPFCIRSRRAVVECYSMPMGTYGGAVVLSESEDIRSQLTERFIEWCREKSASRINVVEFASQADPLFEQFDFRELSTQVVDLSGGIEQLRSALSENHRRNIEKCRAFKFSTRRVSTKSDVAAYFSLVDESAGRHDERPRYNQNFYESLLQCIPRENLLWELTCLDDNPCAGHIYFKWGSSVFYWDGASSKAGLESLANFHFFWKNIRQFESEGFAYLNLGASPQAAGDLTRFKKGWGAKLVSYFEYDWSSAAYRGMKQIKDWLGR